jgi:hypothetical protein
MNRLLDSVFEKRVALLVLGDVQSKPATPGSANVQSFVARKPSFVERSCDRGRMTAMADLPAIELGI